MGHENIVRVLIAAGADIKEKILNFFSLYMACEMGHENIVRVLFAAEADKKVTDGEGGTYSI